MRRTTLHRDVAVGFQAQQLFKAEDYYDKLIETYGCIFSQEQQIHYCVSTHADDIYKLLFEGVLQNKLAIECCHFSQKINTSAFTDDEAIQACIQQSENLLKRRYHKSFYTVLQHLSSIPNENLTTLILNNYFSTMKSDPTLIQQTSLWAVQAKILTKEAYANILSLAQISNTIKPQNLNYSKTIYGCAYRTTNSTWNFMCNANFQAFFEQYDKLLLSNYLVGPYWYKSYEEKLSGTILKKQFLRELVLIMNPGYLNLVDTLFKLYNRQVKKYIDWLKYDISLYTEYEKQLLRKYFNVLHINS